MGERRQDRLTGDWVIIAPGRGSRPHAALEKPSLSAPVPAFDPSCPFCSGNEGMLPEIIAETKASTAAGWATRVVANKYPAVDPSTGGYHQVIVEMPRHDGDLGHASDKDMRMVIRAYRERFRALGKEPGIRSIIIFRNRGQRAGASLDHPHSQVIALPWMPPRIRAVRRRSLGFYRRTDRCLLCDLLAEGRGGERLITENKSFSAFVPFAAAFPFETWIVPKRHHAWFAAISADEEADLAAILCAVLAAVREALDDPPYHFAIETFKAEGNAAPALHWRLRLVPNITVSGGFELGAGLTINPSSPEDAAACLRKAASSR